jgi:segregation and condensation protein B
LQKAEKPTLNLDTESIKEKSAEKMEHDLALLEAALYVAGRPLNLNELCSVLKTRSKNKVKKLAKELMKAYASRNTALEILELKDERYVLQLKADFTPYVRKFVTRPLLSIGPLKTLSYIAYRQPVSQKRVVEVRGHHAYGHLRMLKEMGLISAERSGRSTVLRTTEYFADYFGLSHDIAVMKKELKNVFEDYSKQEKPKS